MEILSGRFEYCVTKCWPSRRDPQSQLTRRRRWQVTLALDRGCVPQVERGFHRRAPGSLEEAFNRHATFVPAKQDSLGRFAPVRPDTPRRPRFLQQDRLRPALQLLDLDVRDEDISGIFYILDHDDSTRLDLEEFRTAVQARAPASHCPPRFRQSADIQKWGVQAPTAVGGWVRSLKLCEARTPLRDALRTPPYSSLSSFLLLVLLPPFLYSTPAVYCEINVSFGVNERVVETDLSK